MPLGCPLDVSWEIVLLPLSYREGEVSVEDYCDFFGVSHDVLLRWCGGGFVDFLREGQEVVGSLYLCQVPAGTRSLYDLYRCVTVLQSL